MNGPQELTPVNGRLREVLLYIFLIVALPFNIGQSVVMLFVAG